MRSAQSYRHYIYARCCPGHLKWEMKFNSSSCMLKPVYFAFVKTMLEFFLQTTHFFKSRAHSPRPTSKLIAMIPLRRAILMKADPVVSLHAHCLFSGRACPLKKRPLLWWSGAFFFSFCKIAYCVNFRLKAIKLYSFSPPPPPPPPHFYCSPPPSPPPPFYCFLPPPPPLPPPHFCCFSLSQWLTLSRTIVVFFNS